MTFSCILVDSVMISFYFFLDYFSFFIIQVLKLFFFFEIVIFNDGGKPSRLFIVILFSRG